MEIVGDTEEVQSRVRKFLLYDRIMGNYMLLLIGCVLFGMLLGYFITRLMNIEFSSNVGFSSVLFGGLLSVLLMLLLGKKRRDYYVDSDEWARFYTYSIFTNLSRYLSSPSSGTKKTFKKKALKDAKGFLSCIEERWTIGIFKPVRQLVGNSISDLEKNIKYRVIPAIKDGDEKTRKQVHQIMYNFHYSGFSIETINEINKQMSDRLPNKEPLKRGYWARGLGYFKAHSIVRHSVALATFGFSSFIVGYVFWTRGVSIDNAWLGGIALFGILTGIYFSTQHRSEWRSADA
jgi:hypothetical protein